MDNYQLEQLKKYVMDLDKSLTRLKSFIDQQENELGFDLPNTFDKAFPPLSTRLDRGAPQSMPLSRKTEPTQPQNPSHKTLAYEDLFKKMAEPTPQAAPANPSVTPTQTNTVLTPTETKPVQPAQAPGDAAVQSTMEGTFDGKYLITPTGQKVEIPTTYANKSRILYGDTVATYVENSETKFKVTKKQPRKALQGLAVKKDANWHVITGIGSYTISNSAAEFNSLQQDQEIKVLVPETNTSVPYAAFDEVAKAQPSTPLQPQPTPISKPDQNANATNSSGAVPKQQSTPQPAKQPKQPEATKSSQSGTAPSTQQPKQADKPSSQTQQVDPALRVIEDFDLV